MKIAIATEGSIVSGHFGKCENFTIVEIENKEVKNRTNLNTLGNQHGLLPTFLASHQVDMVIVGGMGEGARQKLTSVNIEIITGVNGTVEDTLSAYLNGSLKSTDAGCPVHGQSHAHRHEGEGCNCEH